VVKEALSQVIRRSRVSSGMEEGEQGLEQDRIVCHAGQGTALKFRWGRVASMPGAARARSSLM
jgi:hypothetical protein